MTDPLADLVCAFPRFAADCGSNAASVAATYRRNLEDIPPLVLAAACKELIATEDWMPSVAKIRNACAERMLCLPDEGQALAQVEEKMRAVRDGSEPPELHPVVKSVFDLLGGHSALREATDPSVWRGQFGRLYREARAREIRTVQIGSLALEGREAQRLSLSRPAVS